jgi:predicted enzyme related to lactoylglutathione lyase
MGASERMISGVDFISISTHDLDSSVAFYGSTLGLEVSVHLPDRHFAEFETGNLTINVMDFEKAGLPHRQGQNAIALHVDDVQAARSALSELGVAFQGDTFDSGVCHMAFFADPDGNALMLHHRYAPRVTGSEGAA